ncbi:MAG: NCS2 family permease, partial [Acidobacteria bacterium]|nr:NCS2 family permease [Acidobacteriota bacterium]
MVAQSATGSYHKPALEPIATGNPSLAGTLFQTLFSRFQVDAAGSTLGRECMAGVTTYLALAYIFFVQPAVLSAAGMDFGAVLSATCISSAVATLLMAFLANYPIALAPAMGHNFFFAYTVVLAQGVPWRVALAAVFISGSVFILTSSFGFRERLIESIPESMQHAIAVGIGLLIALVGLEWSGLVVASPGTLVTLGNLKSPPVLLALFGLVVTAGLFAIRTRGALLWGILITSVAGAMTGLIRYQGIVSRPPSLLPTFLQLDIPGTLRPGMISVVLVFFLLMLFDTVGTLVGVAHQAGFMKGGKLPRARRALLADAIGTVQGALLGTSTVT